MSLGRLLLRFFNHALSGNQTQLGKPAVPANQAILQTVDISLNRMLIGNRSLEASI